MPYGFIQKFARSIAISEPYTFRDGAAIGATIICQREWTECTELRELVECLGHRNDGLGLKAGGN
jgi:hypothetical protein